MLQELSDLPSLLRLGQIQLARQVDQLVEKLEEDRREGPLDLRWSLLVRNIEQSVTH